MGRGGLEPPVFLLCLVYSQVPSPLDYRPKNEKRRQVSQAASSQFVFPRALAAWWPHFLLLEGITVIGIGAGGQQGDWARKRTNPGPRCGRA